MALNVIRRENRSHTNAQVTASRNHPPTTVFPQVANKCCQTLMDYTYPALKRLGSLP